MIAIIALALNPTTRAVFIPGLLSLKFVSAHLADDAAGACDPLEWLWVLVVSADVVVDCNGEFADAAEGAAADSLASDLCEPTFDLIQPGRTGGREVEVWSEPQK